MFKTRGRKILRDVWSRKGRTFLVSAAIFIGVLGTIALFSMNDLIISQMRKDIQENELAMISIFTTVNPGVELDDDSLLESLGSQPGVDRVLGSQESLIGYKLSEDDSDFQNGIYFSYTVPYEEGLPIEPMRLVEGAYPSDTSQVAVEQRLADEHGLAVGDSIYVRVLSPSRNPEAEGDVGTLEARSISGIVFHPYVALFYQPNQAIYGLAEDVGYVGSINGLTRIMLRLDEFPNAPSSPQAIELAEDKAQELSAIVSTQSEYVPVFTNVQDPANNLLIANTQVLTGLMQALALISLIVSGFLVFNVISSIVVEQKRQIGVMKSIGATRRDTVLIFTGIAFMYGLIAVIPGVLLGVPLGYLIANLLAPELGTLVDSFRVSWGSVIIGVVVGLMIPVLAALLPVFNAMRVKILDAMTDFGIDANYGSGPIARFIGILPIPITIRQGLSNVSIKKWRMAFTVLTLAIAVGAFMGIFGIFDSITSGLGSYFDTFNVELLVQPTQTRNADEFVGLLRENFQVSDEEVQADLVSYLNENNIPEVERSTEQLMALRSGDIEMDEVQALLPAGTPERVSSRVFELLQRGDLLSAIEPGFQYQVEFEGFEDVATAFGPPGIFAYGYDVNSPTPAFEVTISEGEAITDANRENSIIFSNALATAMGKAVGDKVVMTVPGGRAELTIVGISEFPLNQVWLDWRTIARIAGFTSGAPKPNEYITELTLNGSPVSAGGMDEQFLNFLQFSEGEAFTVGEAGVIVSQPLAEAQNIAVGDSVSLTAANGTSEDYPVTGIFTLPEGLPAEQVPEQVVAMFWQDLMALEGRSADGDPLPAGYFLISNREDPSAQEISQIQGRIENLLLEQGVPTVFFNIVEFLEQFGAFFQILQVVLSLVAGLIALVGALGLLTTLSMSVFERQKEIGVMRSIGAGSGTVAAQFLTEGLVVGIAAWLVGLPLGLGIEWLVFQASGLDETFLVSYPVTGMVMGLVGMILITLVASLWPSLAAARKTVSDILRYQ